MPSAKLKPFINSYKIITASSEVVNRVVPDTSITLGIRLRGNVNYVENGTDLLLPRSLVAGLRKTVRLVHYHADSSMLVVQFTNAGAAAFLHCPLHELFGLTVGLNDFYRTSEVNSLEQLIRSQPNDDLRIAMLEKYLHTKLSGGNADPLMRAVVDEIQWSAGTIRVHDLVQANFMSEDAFTKRFRRLVGATPKQYASIVRMKSAIQLIKSAETLTSSAYDAGYFDQSHFIKDFKSFTGLSPSSLRKGEHLW